ncbi:hypothetical protein [Bacillus cereus group sp. BfR-BA-01309]|uniref:hypothetical protein n=1 Tax=Bacillus cereus group sp. BfR-BA-01309 TaxID=2920286 RepID=UPI001F59DE85|nr:hypothetical protein [Bacillus cereus group sp. BfR-BA-01309]
MMLRYVRVREILSKEYNVSLDKNSKDGQVNRLFFDMLREKEQSFFYLSNGKMISVGIKQYMNYWIMSTDKKNHYIAINPDYERKYAKYEKNDNNQKTQTDFLSSCAGILKAVTDSKIDEEKKKQILNILVN